MCWGGTNVPFLSFTLSCKLYILLSTSASVSVSQINHKESLKKKKKSPTHWDIPECSAAAGHFWLIVSQMNAQNSSDLSQTVRLSHLYIILLSVVFLSQRSTCPSLPAPWCWNHHHHWHINHSHHTDLSFSFYFFKINQRRHACVLLQHDRALTCRPPPCLREAVSGCGLGCLPVQWLPVWAGWYLGGQVEVCCLTSSMWLRSGMGTTDRRLCPVSDWGLGLVTGPSVLLVSGCPPNTSSTPPLSFFRRLLEMRAAVEADRGPCGELGWLDGLLPQREHTHTGAHLPPCPLSCHASAPLTATPLPTLHRWKRG